MNIAHLREIEKWHLLENESNQRARENLVNRFAPVEAARCRPHLGKVYIVDTLPPQIPALHSTGVMEHGDFWWILCDNSESILLLHIARIHKMIRLMW